MQNRRVPGNLGREAGAVTDWVFFGERRMSTDAALYIQFTDKSEEIANQWAPEVDLREA